MSAVVEWLKNPLGRRGRPAEPVVRQTAPHNMRLRGVDETRVAQDGRWANPAGPQRFRVRRGARGDRSAKGRARGRRAAWLAPDVHETLQLLALGTDRSIADVLDKLLRYAIGNAGQRARRLGRGPSPEHPRIV